MLICLNDLFACSGLAQTRKLLTNFSKNSFYLLPEPLRLGEFLTNYWIEVRKDIDLEHTYSGMIEKKQELEDVIKTLQNSIPIKYKIESDKVLIEPVE